MPAPFSAVHIPFLSGVRQDIGKLAQDNPAQLRAAKNVMFTKKGHLTGRPGLVSRDAQVQTAPTVALDSSLATAVAGAVPTGIVSVGYPSDDRTEIDTPLVCYQGKSYFNHEGLWEFAGVHWSVRQTRSAALETHDPTGTLASQRGAEIPVGKDLVGVLTTVGNSTGVPFLTDTGEVKWVSSGVPAVGSTFNNIDRRSTRVVGNAMFWAYAATNRLYGMFTTGDGPTTTGEMNLAGIGGVCAIDACTDGTFYYVAASGGAGPPTSIVFKIDSAGTVLQTLNLTWAAGSMTNSATTGICYDPTTNRLGVVSAVAAGGAVATKIITLTAGVMADAGIELTLTGTAGVGSNEDTVMCGVTHNGKMSVLYNRKATDWTTGAAAGIQSGTVYVGGRLFTAATETSFTTLNGAVNPFGFGEQWEPMFAGQAVAGRTLIGVWHGYETVNRACQWVVMDMTDLYATTPITTRRTVVACGAVNGSERTNPASVYCDGSKLAFGVADGLVFGAVPDTTPSNGTGNVPLVQRAASRRITLESQGVQAVHVHDTTLLSGQLMHVFDGSKIRPHHFPEETPYILQGGNGYSYVSAGGSLAAGSYTYQATWEAVNARGQTIRSGASAPLTVAGVALNQKVTVTVTKPQLWNNASPSEYVRVRLWATQTNPTNNAAKYLAAETVTSTPYSGFSVTLVHTTVASGIEEQLYETSDTLADMRAPGADRGVAVVNERVWCADQTKLYVSKLIKPNIAVSWNTEDTNVLSLPATLGTIQGLAATNQALVVMCSRGAAVVTGPGVDDTGTGPGWVLQIIDGVPGMGTSNPRSCTAIPMGVAFQAQDGDVWLAPPVGKAVPLSRPLRDSAIADSPTGIDVVNVTSTPTTNSMLIAHGADGVLRVLDLEHGAWATWNFASVVPPNGLFLASINGVLWMQTTSPGVVYSVDDYTSVGDAGLGNFTATIETGVLRPANPAPHGWGRLRSVIVTELRKSTDTQVSIAMQVLADQNDRVLMNKVLTTNPTDTTAFPGAGDGVLTFGTTVQRCAFARIIMSITPAVFDMEGLDLWVANTGERAPSNTRS